MNLRYDETDRRHLPICTMGNLIMSCTNACTALSFFGYISFFEIESWKRSKFVAFLLYKQQEERERKIRDELVAC